MATVARWLGPWADIHARPARVSRRPLQVPCQTPDKDSFEAWLYAPTDAPIAGAYAIAPGLHFEGPGDPRMDRFCRILAASGCLVISPFIDDFMHLRVTPRALLEYQDAIRALVAAPEYPRGRAPWLFSISFGSLLALRAACAPELAAHIGGVILFGGYADWRAVVHFCMTGELTDGRRVHHDPLNQPVVFLTMLDELLRCADVDPAHGPALAAAWLTFTRRTWSSAGQKRHGTPERVAHDLGADLPDEARDLFLMGCGARSGGLALCQQAMERFDGAYMEVRGHLHRLRCPVHIAHGVDDDVIPVEHAHALADAMPAGHPHALYITGLYSHTALGSPLRLIPALGREVATLARLVRVIASP